MRAFMTGEIPPEFFENTIILFLFNQHDPSRWFAGNEKIENNLSSV
jgi:hypothetical protein